MHGTIESGFSVEVQGVGALAAFADDLRALTERALIANVFYEPAFIAAAAPVFGRELRAGLVWRRGATKELVGFFPVVIERRRYGLTLSALTGFTHPYAPFGMPLIDRDCSVATVTAWLDHINATPDLPKLLLMPLLPAAGTAVFEAALAQRNGRCAEFGCHVRAMLRPDFGRAGYLEVAIPRRKRKELRRQRNRLSELGAFVCERADMASAVTAALADFLALEASGWKGRAGTAAIASEAVRRFVETAVSGLAAEGKASVLRLVLDGHAIAASVTLRSGDAAWCWKIAYDEALARYSPGVQCMIEVTKSLLEDDRIARADSCATPDHPMIDHIWRERLVLSDRLMTAAPCSAARFAGVCALESARRAAIGAARTVRNFVRRK